jgi:integrase
MFDKLVVRYGLPRISLHGLRHTWATLALQAGVHGRIVERLGHSSISITLDIYSHAIPAMQTDAAERVASLVFGTDG